MAYFGHGAILIFPSATESTLVIPLPHSPPQAQVTIRHVSQEIVF